MEVAEVEHIESAKPADFEHVETVDLNLDLDERERESDCSSICALLRKSSTKTSSPDSLLRSFRNRSGSSSPSQPRLSVLDIIPNSFADYYPPELFMLFPPTARAAAHVRSRSTDNTHSLYPSDEGLFSSFGIADLYLRRPSFSYRDLVDWERNDLRSLCFLPDLRPDTLPAWWPADSPVSADSPPLLREEGFHIVVLPLNATDDAIVETLANSDIYLEFAFSQAHRQRLARQTIDLCLRNRLSVLTKPEWRRLIDNYLLALGCEAQARVDFQVRFSYDIYLWCLNFTLC